MFSSSRYCELFQCNVLLFWFVYMRNLVSLWSLSPSLVFRLKAPLLLSKSIYNWAFDPPGKMLVITWF